MLDPAEFIEHHLRPESGAQEGGRGAIAEGRTGRFHPGKELFPISEYLAPPDRDLCDLQNLFGNDLIESLLPFISLDGPFGYREQLGHLADGHGERTGKT